MTAKCANFLLGPGLCLTGRPRARRRDIEPVDELFEALAGPLWDKMSDAKLMVRFCFGSIALV